MIIMPDADMDQAVDALIGAGYGSAGERCMAVSVAVPVGKATADALIKKLVPRVEALKIGLSSDAGADYGPLVTKAALDRVQTISIPAWRRARNCWSMAVASRCRAMRMGFSSAARLFDHVTPEMKIYKEEIFGPVLSVVRAAELRGGAAPAERA